MKVSLYILIFICCQGLLKYINMKVYALSKVDGIHTVAKDTAMQSFFS